MQKLHHHQQYLSTLNPTSTIMIRFRGLCQLFSDELEPGTIKSLSLRVHVPKKGSFKGYYKVSMYIRVPLRALKVQGLRVYVPN